MTIIKVSELSGAALDWAVAKCEDFREGSAIIRVWNNRVTKIIPGDYETSEVYTSYAPSTDWAQGGPIIERELIATRENADSPDWYACKRWDSHGAWGTTPLIAAVRCYVASKLGDEIEIPEELTGN